MSYKNPEKLQNEAINILSKINGSTFPLKPKDAINIPQQDMPSQNPLERKNNMKEVALGYTQEQASIEALRCLQCKNAPCIKSCPVSIDIPSFIKAVAEGNNQKAINIIKEVSLLPAVCGRVCPQETQCQLNCTVGKSLKDVNKSVSIGRIERFVADWERTQGNIESPQIKKETGRKIAIIGTGPAGITVAADLRREGHAVTMFEAFHKPGGVMVYGIPEFRLPKEIVKEEIDTLKKMGIKVVTDYVVGRTRKILDLMNKDGFNAIFIGSGAGLPKFMNIEGENSIGVFSANEYLTRTNLMKAYDKGNVDTPIFPSKKVAVLGGGNVAMDSARTAIRLGAKEVHLIYRRTEVEMPARVEEVAHAKEEGVIFHLLNNANKIISDDNEYVKSIEVLKYELGEADDSGRKRPVVIKGSEFTMDIDTVIVAIGNGSNPLINQTTPGLETNKWGNIVVDEHCKTSIEGIYAGGDIVLGAATVILAMGQGRTAAKAINNYLQ